MVLARRIAGYIVPILVIITTKTNVFDCVVFERSPDKLIKEEETVTLWCATRNE